MISLLFYLVQWALIFAVIHVIQLYAGVVGHILVAGVLLAFIRLHIALLTNWLWGEDFNKPIKLS